MKRILTLSLGLVLVAGAAAAGPVYRPNYMLNPAQQNAAMNDQAQITELKNQSETLQAIVAAQQEQLKALAVMQQQQAQQIELQKQTIQFLNAQYQLQVEAAR